MEKKVILEEIALYLDRPAHVLFEAVMGDHFENHPMANSVLGTKESVGALARDRMKAYFDAHYGPGNMVLAVAGKVDFPALLADAERCCGAGRASTCSALPRHRPPPEAPPYCGRQAQAALYRDALPRPVRPG